MAEGFEGYVFQSKLLGYLSFSDSPDCYGMMINKWKKISSIHRSSSPQVSFYFTLLYQVKGDIEYRGGPCLLCLPTYTSVI